MLTSSAIVEAPLAPDVTGGRSAELVPAAHAGGTERRTVLRVARNLVVFNGLVALGLLAYALYLGLSAAAIFALLLTAILASIPVALPATFTLAAEIGARFLAANGVIPTRRAAVDEAGSIDVLCCDKTGSLTLDELRIVDIRPMPGFETGHVLAFAALASDEGGQDPVDAAIRVAASKTGRITGMPTLVKFEPFDPTTKMSAATLASWPAHRQERVVKGAFAAVSAVALPHPYAAASAAEVQEKGYRVLAVAAGPLDALQLVGFIALSDSPRPDSADSIWRLEGLGVRTVMVTGDQAPTAEIVAAAVGISGPVFSGSMLPPDLTPETFAVYADVVPDDKYRLVREFERSGHVVGMCGDGVDDAPALRQARMGIAVAGATDIAKAAAGIVLTTAGLGGVVIAVKAGRITFGRTLTYTLNVIAEKLVVVMLLVVGLLMTRHAVLTPTLMVVLVLTGDFLTMSLTTDNVTLSPLPNVWRVGNLTLAGTGIALCLLGFCSGVLAFGTFRLHLNLGALQTLTFVALAFGTQATLYAIRERRHVWCLRPSPWLLLSSVADVGASTFFALHGVLMKPLPWIIVACMFGAAVLFALLLNFVKLPLFAGLKVT